MANTKRRTNISLDTKLFKTATAYGKENGISLSALIEQGLRLRLAEQSEPVLIEQTNLAPVPLPDLEALASARIEENIPELLMAWLESARGAERLERILVPYVNERVALLKGRAAPPATSTPKPSTSPPPRSVEIPLDVRDRLQKYSLKTIMEITGMDRTSVSQYRTGKRPRAEEKTLNRLVEALDVLESQTREPSP